MLAQFSFVTLAEADFSSIINFEIIRGNPLWRFALVLIITLLAMAAARVVQFIVHVWAGRIKTKSGITPLSLITDALSKPAYVAVLALGISVCKLPLYFSDVDGIRTAILDGWSKTAHVVAAIAVAFALYRLVDVCEYYLNRVVSKTETKLDDMLVPVIRKSLRITIAIISVLLISENILGTNVKSLILSAGVGGIAIALAAKDSIANFFGSITIFADRPFQVGDMVKVGKHMGPVEEVGFRSTRIRTLQGHLVTVPNNVIANEMIENIGRRPFIRRTTSITITYDSGFDKMQKALQLIKDILAGVPEVNEGPDTTPRVFFSDFNDCSLGIHVSYWVTPADYKLFLAVNERINLAILKKFNAEGIEFAFPTQTLYLKKDTDGLDG